MPATLENQTCDDRQAKAQPWKAHWPPRENKAVEGVEYGVEKGAVIVVDGTSARVAPLSKEKVSEKENEDYHKE